MPARPIDPDDFTKPIKFKPIDKDPDVLRELAEVTKLRGAALIRHALAELHRRERRRAAAERAAETRAVSA